MLGRCGTILLLSALLTPAWGASPEVSSLLVQIKAVGKEGAGNVEASKAWRELTKYGPEVLPRILPALDDADATAANWLRTAVDAIAEREVKAGRPLPAGELEAFIRETNHSGEARRIAYEWLCRVDPTTPDRFLPGMLQDPSVELRRDAVARMLKLAEKVKEDKEAAKDAYEQALTGARDKDQVDLIVKELKALGTEVDVAGHFGFVRQWKLVGSFDNKDGKGFNVAYPPEEKVDLATTYKGKGDAEAKWIDHTTTDAYGVVDLNKAIAKVQGTTAYAFAEIHSKNERPVQLRAGSPNAIKIFLNGKQIFFREEYHHGSEMDTHVGHGTLKAGRNEVLVKVCQNEQKEEWAQNWQFQLRICDAVGSSVPVTLAMKPSENSEKGGQP